VKYEAVKDRILAEVNRDITVNGTPPHEDTESERTKNDPFEVSLIFITCQLGTYLLLSKMTYTTNYFIIINYCFSI
jgi:hypothetical protein